MNLNHAAYSFAYAGAAILTGVARDAGWTPGLVLSIAALAVLLGTVLAVEGGQGVNGFARTRDVPRWLGMVPVWGGLIAMVAFMAENASENWSALHIERSLGGSKHEGSFGPAVLALTMGVGRTFGQILVANVDEGRMMHWGAVIAALGTALVGLAPTPFVAYAGLIVAGLGGSVLAPNVFAVVGRLSPPALRAHMIARATALGYLGYFFGPPALGFLSELVGLGRALVVMAGVILSILILYPRLITADAAGRHKT
jgi:MFS family permease